MDHRNNPTQKITMTLSTNDYQDRALDTAIYPNRGANFVYPALGLAGEAGEVADKLKKVIRDNDGVLTDSVRDAVAAELGDVMWYVAVLAAELDYDLDEKQDADAEHQLDANQWQRNTH